ncbi:MAG TPA: type II toxin-antitoxin system VapC family toxin [Patescibacteria group bacterium]|nr:type II toxin-antitoxin system VapC family toxin [Patescibacteria group bacterium]
MNVVVDTSAIIAVVTNERHKRQMVEVTKGTELIAPASIPWEIGNAFSAMFKRKRMNVRQAKAALRAYDKIPIQLIDIPLGDALDLAVHLDIYAYDAYVIQCALMYRSPLLTLDRNLCRAARRSGAAVIEMEP